MNKRTIWMQKALPATLLAVISCVALAFGAGSDGSGGLAIWPLFGTTNQLLAGLTLMVITVMLVRLGRPMYVTLLPLIFLLIMTVFALFIQLKGFYMEENWFLFGLDIVVLIAAVWIALEATSALSNLKKEQKS